MNPDNVIVRYEQVDEQVEGPVRRIIGFVRAKNMLPLFDAADLEANPRSAKSGPVTDAIIDSIRGTPETFPFKTKGVLAGASEYDKLERNRYQLRFKNTRIEGILDGGHNMLAIGTHILANVLQDDKLVRKIKRWPDFKEAWVENRAEVEAFRKKSSEEGDKSLDFLIPLEILVPSELDNASVVSDFSTSLLDICAARNNNHELRAETKANQKGYYEEMRKALPTDLAARIEWKTNDGGEIKVRDLIALAWIPLSVIELPVDEDGKQIEPPLPQNIYRNKGACVDLFDRLMGSRFVSKATGGEYRHELHSSAVGSALKLAGEFPALYDKIYKEFPAAYNGDKEGRFGGLAVVKMADGKYRPATHFNSDPVKYAYPDGLIMPLVYGLKSLIKQQFDGTLEWTEDPTNFLNRNLGAIVKKYRVIIDAYNADPQKIGKNEGSYSLVVDAFETELMKQQQYN